MTNKEFVSDVVAQLKANPRKVLAGHGISGAMLNKIKNRDDIFAKVGGILNKLKTFKRGAIGLKKSSVFQIKVYKNFTELNTKARADIDTFVAGLKSEDANEFKNENNIVCVVFDPKDCELEGEDERVVAGFSKLEKFDNVVRKEYKLPGVAYMVIMYADSAIRTVEMKAAERKASRNERENKRESKPAKLRKALADKKKLAAKIRKIKADYKEKFDENNQELKKLRAQQQRLRFQNQQIASVGQQNAINRSFRSKRVELLKAKLANAVAKAEQLVASLEGTTGNRRLSIQSSLSKKNKEIRQLRAALGTYNRLGPAAIAKKGEMLHKVQDEIQKRIANNESLSSAMNAALDAINARPAQKQIIKQQVINQVAEGMPMQYSVQQALQNVITDDGSITNSELEHIADIVINENNGKAPKPHMLNYQISRNGYFLDSDDVTRIGEIINNKLLNAKEVDEIVDAGETIDANAEIDNSDESIDFQDLVNAIDETPAASQIVKPKRKRRTKKEIAIAKKLALRAKREREKAKKEKLRAIKLAKKQRELARKEKLAALNNKKIKTQKVPNQLVNQIKGTSMDFQDLIDAIDETPVINTPVIDKIDPVVQQIIDGDYDDNFVNPDDEVIPDLNDSLNNTTDFAALLNML